MSVSTAVSNFSDNNIVILNDSTDIKYNPQAAFYALPKAFIFNILASLTPSTVKVFLALSYHTDPFNRIKYPENITHKKLMILTGIKKIDTISKAYAELVEKKIIGGYCPGKGSENTRFYFTFDYDHYKNDGCCFKIEEMESYYIMITSLKKVNNKKIDSFEVPEQFEEKTCENNNYDNEYYKNENNDYDLNDNPLKGTPSSQKTGDSLPKKRDTINTIYSYINNINSNSARTKKFDYPLDKSLIESAKQSNNFIQEFNDFCTTRDDTEFREYNFYWLIIHATKYNLSIIELTDCLKITNDKDALEKIRNGKLSYCIGIMKKIHDKKISGIFGVGKELVYQIYEFLELRLKINKKYIPDFKVKADKYIAYKLNYGDDEEQKLLFDLCRHITNDVNKRFSISLETQIIN